MRILSQDGLYKSGNVDLPYEMCALSMGYTGNESKICIYAHFNGTKGQKIAEYSTEAKARRTMEMLIEEWRDYGECGDFRFPADDEVEV